ncbi:MAG TPA: hypothetical protein VK658_21710 [Chryseolinea sp.]|nr:hypothetical protein [Chryseolinea sp.]
MNDDEFIKRSIRKGMQVIDDPDFTEKVIHAASAARSMKTQRPFMAFSSLVCGMLGLIVSSGFVVLYSVDALPRYLPYIDMKSGMIVVGISATFLLYTLFSDLVARSLRPKNFR